MKKLIGIAVAMSALAVCANTPPAITNVRASQREGTKLVDIYYDAADADNDLLKVRIEISDNDGAKYSVPAFSLTGDIGEGIAPGTGKHIVWDAGTDWDGEYSDQMRVKVFAIDAQGFPGMEWGNEVPPGGFLMGQDGGAEGSGPSRHVNIPWSYWLGKYEVTAQQYCDFLNAALTLGYIERVNTTNVQATACMPLSYACKEGALLCTTGDNKPIRWNVNKFECVTEENKTLPANVTWYGAMAFARFYGYDLPTDAEWEKAARGPEHDDADEHLCFPWGNEVSASYANIIPQTVIKPVGYYDGNQVPVGPDTVNGYGLYDVIGNAPEWTLSGESDLEKYPQEELLTNAIHNPFTMAGRDAQVSSYSSSTAYDSMDRIVRGLNANPLYWRKCANSTKEELMLLTGYSTFGSYSSSSVVPNYSSSNEPIGFRVVRRQNAQFVGAVVAAQESFDEWQGVSSYNTSITNKTDAGEWVLSGGARVASPGVNETACIYLENSSSCRFYLPKTSTRLLKVRLNVKASSSSYYYVYLGAEMEDGSTSSNSIRIQDSGNAYQVHSVTIPVSVYDAKAYYVFIGNGTAYIDDVELITLSE